MKAMDNFVNEKFIFAERMVVQHACSKIVEGDVIVTYTHSSVIESILLQAKQVRFAAKRYSVRIICSAADSDDGLLDC